MKRRLAIAAVCLVLGAIVNVLVAWTCWALAGRSPMTDSPSLAKTALDWLVPVPQDWPESPETEDRFWNRFATHRFVSWGAIFGTPNLPSWYEETPEQTRRRERGWVILLSMEYGVPWRSLRTSRELIASNDWTRLHEGRFRILRSGVVINGLSTRWQPLPIDPMPRGFVNNTVFYGVLIWLAGFASILIRRSRRRRRGRCVSCGYDLAKLDTCPECGNER